MAGPANIPGLPVPTYRVQTREAVSLVTANKHAEERVLRILDELKTTPGVDPQMLATGRTQIENGFMWVNRAVFQPERVSLPEDLTE